MSSPARNALIHFFDTSTPAQYDDDGDQMMDFYYQFIDEDDNPVSRLIGPYRYRQLAERAARKAFQSRDF